MDFKLYPNTLRKPIQLSRYNRLLIEVLHAKNLPPRPHVHVTVKLDDVTHKTRTSTQSDNPRWSHEDFVAPLFRGGYLELAVFHNDELLGESQSPVQRLIDGLDIEQTCTLTLWKREVALDDSTQFSSSVTLRMTHLPPFIATSLPQFNLSPTPSSCSLPHASLLTSPVFNPPAHEITRILEALAAVPDAGNVAFVEESLVVKSGSGASIREAMAMVYIQQRTSIPVPKVHMCFQHNDHTYIVMDRIKGQPLEACLSSMTEQQLRSVATQLAGFVRELGTLESDTRRLMGSWPSGPYDNLLFDPPPLHEFRDLEALHSYWIWRLGSHMTISEVPSALCEVGRQCNVVLAHGDLNERNIMVDDGTITGLVDWETLGWYPDFWELMAALRGSSTPKWCDELSVALGPESDLSLQYTSVLDDVFSRPWAE